MNAADTELNYFEVIDDVFKISTYFMDLKHILK